MSRQREQLFKQMLGAGHPFLERSKTFARRLGEIKWVKIFGLQAKSGDGSPQFVCGIGDETPLLIHHRFHALQQPVDRCNERVEFAGRSQQRERGHIIGTPCVEVAG